MAPSGSFLPRSANHSPRTDMDHSTNPSPTASSSVKKRSRSQAGSISGPGGGSPAESADGDDKAGGGGSKARKKRLGLSCSECRRRKISCDRKMPCSACIRRKVAHSCTWEDDGDAAGQFALESDVRHLARRLLHLETLFHQTNPDLLPLHNPDAASAALRPASPVSETEDAALDALDGVFGAQVAVLKAVSAAQAATEALAGTLPPGGPGSLRGPVGERTRFGTSVAAEALSFDQDGRPRSAVRLGLDLAVGTSQLPAVRSAAMSQVFAVLPGKEISQALLDKYFNEMQWDFKVLDPEAFQAEHDRYSELAAMGQHDQIDPLWVAVFCMVLALALEGFWTRPNSSKNLSLFGGLTERELQDLPSVWHDAALRALQLGEWGGTPRIRTVQTIILFGQYIQIASSSGLQGRYLGWFASGVRVAQRLGLHRLSADPTVMPPDDPALPQGRSQFKRELGIRLWHHLVVIDSLLSDSPSLRCYSLHPSQYNTPRPMNANLHELSRTDPTPKAGLPIVSHTDASFQLVLCSLAEQIRRTLDDQAAAGNRPTYSAVLDQDKRLRAVLHAVPDVFASERNPPIDSNRLRYQRALLHEAVFSRILRLHRPYHSRGYHHPQFAPSTQACVAAAQAIINSNHGLLAIANSLWWVFTGTLGAAIVLFSDLFHALDSDAPDKEVAEKREVVARAAVIFATQVASPALQAVVEQGRRILAGLAAAEEVRRRAQAAHALVPGAAEPLVVESFAQVLKRISREVRAEESYHLPAFVGGPGTVQPAAFLTSPQAMPPLNGQAPTPVGFKSGLTPVASGVPGAGGGGGEFGGWGADGGVGVGAGAGGAGGMGGHGFSSFFGVLESEDWVGGGGVGVGEAGFGGGAGRW